MRINGIQSGYYPSQNIHRAKTGATAKSFAEQLNSGAASSAADANGGVEKEIRLHMPDEDTLVSGGHGNGLSYHIKYAANSSKDNPIAIVNGIDENGNEFERTIYLNEVNPYNATVMEIKALEAHVTGRRGGIGITSAGIVQATMGMGVNDRNNFVDALENFANGQIQVGEAEEARRYFELMQSFFDFYDAQKN
jgi:hypothetical protein